MKYNWFEIGKRIQTEREGLDWSQSRLCAEIRRSPDTYRLIGRWEKGVETSRPSLKDMLELCRVFNCQLGYLLCEPEYIGKSKEETNAQRSTGLSKETIENFVEWKKHIRPYFTGRRRLEAINALCSTESGYSALDYLASFLFDEIQDDVTACVKGAIGHNPPTMQETVTIRKEVFSRTFLDMAEEYIMKMKDDLQKKERGKQ